MAIRLEIDRHDTRYSYAIWSEPAQGDKYVGRCIGVGTTLAEAQESARDELLGDLQEIDALEEPDENPREKDEDDGAEYGDPRDHRDGLE